MEVKGKKNTGLIVTLIIFIILALGMGCFIVYDKVLSKNNADTEINTNEDKTEEKESVNDDNDNTNTNSIPLRKDMYLLSNKNNSAQKQRYQLVVVSGGERTAANDIDAEDDTYYLLDMNNLGTNEDLKEINLVSILKPLIDKTIENGMPSSSTNAIGSVTNLSQCNSFSVEYYEPFSNGYLSESIGLNLEKEVPIAVTYFCHTDTYQVAFNRVIYVLDVETNTAREFEYGKTSDFSRQ